MSVIDWFQIHWFQLGAVVLLVAFIVFGLGEGRKVRPLAPDEQPPVRPERIDPGG